MGDVTFVSCGDDGKMRPVLIIEHQEVAILSLTSPPDTRAKVKLPRGKYFWINDRATVETEFFINVKKTKLTKVMAVTLLTERRILFLGFMKKRKSVQRHNYFSGR